MKYLLQSFLVAFLTLIVGSAFGQSTLIHYWNFNTLLTAYHVNAGGVPAIAADYSTLDTSKAKIVYTLVPGTNPKTYGGYIDNVASVDTSNNRLGAPAGQALRLRNPLDSVEMRFLIPTTGYSDIVLKYALESSSTTSGDSTQLFDYSVDGGATWKKARAAGMKVNGANVDTLDTTPPIYQGANWGLVTIDMSADPAVNNNPDVVFRIRFKGNASLNSGNNRFDNVTVEGKGATKPPPATITLSSPATSDILVAGRTTKVMFSTYGPVTRNRTIEYSTDGGGTWSNVGAITDSTNSFVWSVPNTPTTNGELRVKDANNISSSTGKFTILSIDRKKNTVIHYWDFNSFLTQYNNPNIPSIAPDFSAFENTGAAIVYKLEPGTSTNYAGYLDNVPGDTVNARLGAPALQGLRVRNPSDSMELRLLIPTTGFRNISVSYATQSSGLPDAPSRQNFDYSVDGGSTWKKGVIVNGLADTLNVAQPQFLGVSNYGHVSLNFGADTMVNNNSKLVLRIKFTGIPLDKGGNNRFDNISVDGSILPSLDVRTDAAELLQLTLNPNPTADRITVQSPFTTLQRIIVFNARGEVVLSQNSSEVETRLDVANLAGGAYYVRIESSTGKSATGRFVKE